MSIMHNILTVLGLILLCLGALVFVFEIIGTIKYKFLLNRMHAAGMGDTLGLFLSILGLILISGINYTSLKLVLVVTFMWFTSPTSSHLISGLETLTDEELEKYVDVQVEGDIKRYVDSTIEEDK